MTKQLTESLIIGDLKEAEAGIPVPEVCRTHGAGQRTFYKWRSRYGGMVTSDIRRIKELKDKIRLLIRIDLMMWIRLRGFQTGMYRLDTH